MSSLTPAKKKANEKYERDKVDRINFRMPKGKKEQLKLAAEKRNVSVNTLLNMLVDEELKSLN